MHKKDYHMAPARDMREKSDEGVWETVKVIIQALLIAFFVRTFFYQPFNIPSESMYPTLKVGDYLFVSKLSYGYSKYSFNFSFGGFGTTWIKCCPIDFPGRVVLADTPKRGDVAVFKLPTDTNIDYIKRVIGLPGDRIEAHDGHVFIDGRQLNEPYLPAGIQIKPLARQTVPSNSIFVMGDNRPSSKDSTVFGPISKNLVVGRAFIRVWPLSAINFL